MRLLRGVSVCLQLHTLRFPDQTPYFRQSRRMAEGPVTSLKAAHLIVLQHGLWGKAINLHYLEDLLRGIVGSGPSSDQVQPA